MEHPEPTSGARRTLTVVALVLGMFMAALEATVVSTAMPTVISDLGGVALYGWVASAYLLASTVTVPVFGALADRQGRRPILMLGTVAFLVGSVACGFSRSLHELVLWRALQGVGAGAMQPVTLTVVGDLYSVEERGRVQGVFGAVWGIAGVSGPLLGGLIVQHLTWHWVFWINVPFGVASMILLGAAYREPPRSVDVPPFDLAGAVLLTLAASAWLAAASGVQPWLLGGVGGLLAAWLLRVERTAAAPVLPLGALRQRTLVLSLASSVLLGVTMMGTLTYVPLHLQGSLGRSPTEAGSVVALLLVGWPVAATLTGRAIVRTGFRVPIRAGSVIVAAALVGFALALATHQSLGSLRVGMLAYGFGMGFATTSVMIGVQSSVARDHRGAATSLVIFTRAMGGTLGVGALGALFAARLRATADPERVSHLLAAGRAGASAELASLGPALEHALAPTFWILAVLAVANLLVVAFYPPHQVGDAVAPTQVGARR